MPAMLTLFVCSVALVAFSEVTASCTGGNCAAEEASSASTNGAALLQLKGTVGKRGTADAAHAADSTESSTQDAAATHERSEAESSMPKKPIMVSDSTEDGFGAGADFKFGANNNNNNNDNELDISAGNNDNNLDTNMNNNNNDIRKELNSVDKSLDPTKDNNNNDMDFTKDGKDLSGKDKKNGKKDPKLDNIESHVDNFDFGNGKVKKSEKEASEDFQRKVDKAVRKVDSALKDAAASEKAVHDGLERIVQEAAHVEYKISAQSIQDLTKISDTMGDAESKIKEAQKAVENLKSGASNDYGLRSWLLAFACSWCLSQLF